MAPKSKINLNTASQEELTRIEGVDVIRARHIVEYRKAHGPFKSWDDVDKVPGIGEVMLRKLQEGASIGAERGAHHPSPR